MKKLFLIFFVPIVLLANPDWFYNLKHTGKHEVIGYGADADLSKAKQSAISDITNSISVSVSSSVNISSSDTGGKAKQNSSVNLQTESKAVLSGVEFIKTEQQNGIWYVVARYDNSPLEVKLKRMLPKNIKNEKQNKYLKHTWAVRSLNAYIGKKLDYKITRKDNLWQLRYGDILIPITQEDLYKFFSNQKNSKISIKANQNIYRQNDEMYFNIKQKEKGYVSILYVEHNGKVGVLLNNKKSFKSFRYPEANSEDIFKIANPYGKTIREMYVVVFSKQPISLHEFENVSENLLDESNYNFHKLVEKLNSVDFSTFVIKIRK